MDDDADTDGATPGTAATMSASVAVDHQPLIDSDENECTMLLGPAKQPLYKGNLGQFSFVGHFMFCVCLCALFVLLFSWVVLCSSHALWFGSVVYSYFTNGFQ